MIQIKSVLANRIIIMLCFIVSFYDSWILKGVHYSNNTIIPYLTKKVVLLG